MVEQLALNETVVGSNPTGRTNMINLLIFGPPGAGKGTQADLIAKKYHLAHLSSGDILRAELSNGELGAKIKAFQDAGELVPDSLIIAMMEKAILNTRNGGFILDGFPRTIEQAKALDGFLEVNNMTLQAILNLELNETEATERVLARGKTSGRSDDNAATAKARFTVYRNQTAPIVAHYQAQGKVIDIDGRLTIEAVSNKIFEKLDK